jgi:hypothetical protein
MGGLTNDVRRFWWAVLAIALLTIVTRLPSLLHPQAIDDEETYSVVANVIVMEVGPTLMRRDGHERIRDLTAAQQDEAPFYEAPAAAASFGSRCQQGNCLR